MPCGPKWLAFCLISSVLARDTYVSNTFCKAPLCAWKCLALYPPTQMGGLVMGYYIIRMRPSFICFMPLYAIMNILIFFPFILLMTKIVQNPHTRTITYCATSSSFQKLKPFSLFPIISMATWVGLFDTLHLYLSWSRCLKTGRYINSNPNPFQ